MSINSQNTYLNIEDAHLRLRTGNVYAQGINIGGITVDPAHGLQRVSDTGNVTSNTLQFANATTAFVTTANVTVGRDLIVTGNATVSSNLTVTGNAVISDDLTVTENLLVSNNLTVTGNTFYTNPASVLVDSNVVAEYTGPHDRPLRKYPEVAMTANSDSGYVASASSSLTSTPAYLAFDGSTGTTWHTQYPYYTENGGVYDPGNAPGATGTYSGTLPSHELVSGYAGEYITLSLPNKIKMSKISINTRVDANLNLDQTQSAEVIVVVGSHDGSTWEFVDTHTVGKYPDDNTIPYTFNVNTSTYYEHIGLICTNTGPIDSVYNTAWSIAKLAFYGYEEGSGSLDTTLKSVYNVPATTGTQLEVYYDGQDYTADTDFDQANEVLDKSGNNLHGSQTGGVGFDSTYKAFTFGAGDYIQTQTLPSTFIDDAQHSIAMWFNLANLADTRHLFWIDDNTTGVANQSPHAVISSAGILRYDFFANDIQLLDQIVPNQWYHLVITFSGGNHQSGTKFYINGVHNTNVSTPSSTATLDIQASSYIVIGANNIGTTSTTFNGSIANFRLYSKALNADQVKELYDYQKDYFLGSKSQVTLYKGHLGVGVTEPSGQLELAGDERIQEYPPRAMTGYETLVEGHGVFCASSSDEFDTAGSYSPWKAFTKSTSTFFITDHSPATYNSDGTPTAAAGTFEGVSGSWLKLKLPYDILLKRINLARRNDQAEYFSTAILYGSVDDTSWDVLHNIQMPTSYTNVDFEINATKVYKYFVVQITKGAGITYQNIGEWRLFGTPGPTTLDKGSLTLGRSLDVPRVSRYDVDTETPRPEKLVVDFDTTVNSSPTDISGKGNHGTFYNGASYSPADKAFNFDGTDDYIKSTISPSITGEFVHSYSIWLNFTALEGNYDYPIIIGSIGALDQTSILRQNSTGQIGPSFGSGYNLFTNLVPDTNRWYHMVVVYRGGAVNTTNVDYYIDGVKQTLTGGSTGTLAIDENTLALGATSTGGEPFKGKISNFKLYNVALEASEVKKLYNLGRTGRSMVISDTAVGIGKVPEAQLDVRGDLRVGGRLLASVPYYAARQRNTNSYVFDESIVYDQYVYTNYPGSFVANSATDGYYQPPMNGMYQVHMECIANGSGNILIQRRTGTTVDISHDERHFNYTQSGWMSTSADALIPITNCVTQNIRIYIDGTGGNGAWQYNTYHGSAFFLWVSDIPERRQHHVA